jgi:hypothetical protein
MPPKVTAVTTTPAIRTPAVMAMSACLKPIPKTKAAAHPDQAPVAGTILFKGSRMVMVGTSKKPIEEFVP